MRDWTALSMRNRISLSMRDWISLVMWVRLVRVARVAGRVAAACLGGGRPALAALALTAAAVLILGNWEILALYALLLLVFAAAEARRRIVIDEFSAGAAGADLAKGSAELLAIELARLGNAFQRAADGGSVEVTALTTRLEFATDLEDFAGNLRGAVSAESTVTIGPVSIPAGAFVTVIGRFVRAPRISGSLRTDGGRLLLAARLSGDGRRGVWRVERDAAGAPPGAASPEALLGEVIGELAARIFADVGLQGTTSWLATRHLAEAIRTYRTARRAQGAGRLLLLEAEQQLLAAVEHDPGAFEIYHNLGVIYTDLKEYHRAISAFGRATELDPSRWEAYYGLAQTRYLLASAGGTISVRHAEAIVELCRRVLELAPSTSGAANAHYTISLARGRAAEHPDQPEAVRERMIASRLSARALALAELAGPLRRTDPVSLRALTARTALFLRVLAVGLAYLWEPEQQRGERRHFPRIARVLELGVALDPSDAPLRFEYGKIAATWSHGRLAAQQLRCACRIGIATPAMATEVWAWLAETEAGLIGAGPDGAVNDEAQIASREEPAVRAARRALEQCSLVDPGTVSDALLTQLQRALTPLRSGEALALERMLASVGDLRALAPVADNRGTARAKALLASLEAAGRRREAGAVCCLLARALIAAADPTAAASDPAAGAGAEQRRGDRTALPARAHALGGRRLDRRHSPRGAARPDRAGAAAPEALRGRAAQRAERDRSRRPVVLGAHAAR